MTPSPRYQELTRLSGAELERLFSAGTAPALESLAGWEWRGWNVPWFAKLLGIKKFIKGFFAGPGGVEGYNIPPRQNRLTEDWEALPCAEAPKRFGFYLVAAVDPKSVDNLYLNALLLDYGASPRNGWYRPERVLRDYLVQPDPKNPDLLIGKAYLALGGPRVPSNFFIIERLRKTEWKPF